MIYLGGGGSADDESRVWDEAFGPGQRIVVWPWAQSPHRWPGTLDWLRGALSAHGGVPRVTLGTSAPDSGLADADVVAVPGGNTFALLAHLRAHGLLDALAAFLSRGGRVYGGSAGALVLGADVGIADAARGGDDDNAVGLRDTRGLDALCGCVVYPHYEERRRAHCARWAADEGVVVVALPERGGAVVDAEGGAVCAGPEDGILFTPDGGVVRWVPGRRIVLADVVKGECV